MSTIPTCAVRAIAQASIGGAPVAGAVIQAKLSSFEIYDGFIAPELVQATTGPDGTAILHLFPNELGAASSFYDVKIIMPDGKTLRTVAVIPNLASVDLHEYAEVPVYEGKPDGASAIAAAIAIRSETQVLRDDADTFAAQSDQNAIAAMSYRNDANAARVAALAAKDVAVPAAATAEEKANTAVDAADAASTAALAAAATLASAVKKAELAASDGAVQVGTVARFAAIGKIRSRK